MSLNSPEQVAQSRHPTLHVASAVRYVECVRLVCACARGVGAGRSLKDIALGEIGLLGKLRNPRHPRARSAVAEAGFLP